MSDAVMRLASESRRHAWMLEHRHPLLSFQQLPVRFDLSRQTDRQPNRHRPHPAASSCSTTSAAQSWDALLRSPHSIPYPHRRASVCLPDAFSQSAPLFRITRLHESETVFRTILQVCPCLALARAFHRHEVARAHSTSHHRALPISHRDRDHARRDARRVAL